MSSPTISGFTEKNESKNPHKAYRELASRAAKSSHLENFMFRYITVLVCLIALSGCASIKPPTAVFDATKRYRPVAIVINDGIVDKSTVWTGYYAMTIVDQTSAVIKEELAKTGVFESVELNNPYQEVVLSLVFARKITDENLIKSVFQGGTLMLVPTTNDFVTRAEVSVRVRAETVRKYEYEFKTRERMFLADDAYAGRREVAKAIWSLFLADAQKDKLFEEIIPASLARQVATVK